MNKVVCCIGDSGSGKTTLCFQMARKLENLGFSSIIVNFDKCNPLHYLVNNSDKYTCSLGYLLTKESPASEADVLGALIPISKNVSFLSYLYDDTFNKYSKILDERIIFLFDVLKNLSDFVILDCMPYFTNSTTFMSVLNADHVIKVYNPRLKSLSYDYTIQNNNFKSTHTIHDSLVWNKVRDYHDIVSLSSSLKASYYYQFPFMEEIEKNENMPYFNFIGAKNKFDFQKFDNNLNKLVYDSFDLKKEVDVVDKVDYKDSVIINEDVKVYNSNNENDSSEKKKKSIFGKKNDISNEKKKVGIKLPFFNKKKKEVDGF